MTNLSIIGTGNMSQAIASIAAKGGHGVQQLGQLKEIGDALLSRLDPDGRMTALYDPERSE